VVAFRRHGLDSAWQVVAFRRYVFIQSLEPCRREPRFFATEWFNRARGEHKLSYMIVAARTLERVLLVTGNHLGFGPGHLDQVHLSAAPRTPHVRHHSLPTVTQQWLVVRRY